MRKGQQFADRFATSMTVPTAERSKRVLQKKRHDPGREQCRVDREHFNLLELLYSSPVRGLQSRDTGAPSLESDSVALPAWCDIRVGTHKSEGTRR